jgi:hypothetical protein
MPVVAKLDEFGKPAWIVLMFYTACGNETVRLACSFGPQLQVWPTN